MKNNTKGESDSDISQIFEVKELHIKAPVAAIMASCWTVECWDSYHSLKKS